MIGTVSSTPSITVFWGYLFILKALEERSMWGQTVEDGVILVQELSRHKTLARLHRALFTVLGDGVHEPEKRPEIRAS